MKRLILIDSDGTLRRSDGTFSDKVKDTIKKVLEAGHYVVVCTGRPRYHTEKIMQEVGSSPIIISNNGADIYNVITKQEIGINYIDKDECFKIIEYAYLNDLRLVVSCGYIEYVLRDLRNDNQVLLECDNYKEQLKDKDVFQCLIVERDVEKLDKLKEEVLNNETIQVKNSMYFTNDGDDIWLTIGNLNSNKGSALVTLADYLNIPIENTIAIGNDYNDIPMLKEAGFSVCVDNALDEVKEYADYITSSNDSDGVAEILEKVLDGEL